MKIKFIIVGWHYNQEDYIDGLIELKNENDIIDVFWSCHKEPPQKIKDNFEWKLFPNLGMADGGYQQAVDYLDLDDEDVCFFTNDDIIVKDWNFISVCLDKLKRCKVIGNCVNYPTTFNPDTLEKVSGKTFKELAKESSRHLFDNEIFIKTVRGSFMCMKYKSLKDVDMFEPIFHHPELIEPKIKENGQAYVEGFNGIGGIGNLILNLFSYKLNKVLGINNIDYLSNRYLDSDYIYECARGEVDPNNPLT